MMTMKKRKKKSDCAKFTQTFEEQIKLAASAEAFFYGQTKKNPLRDDFDRQTDR